MHRSSYHVAGAVAMMREGGERPLPGQCMDAAHVRCSSPPLPVSPHPTHPNRKISCISIDEISERALRKTLSATRQQPYSSEKGVTRLVSTSIKTTTALACYLPLVRMHHSQGASHCLGFKLCITV
jgi:hypothetical protein